MLQVPEGERLEILPTLRTSLLVALEHLLIIGAAIARISSKEFESHNLLFKDAKARFEEQHRAFKLLCQAFNLLAVDQKELLIDLDDYKSALEERQPS